MSTLTRLPVRRSPLPDELLSSWYQRLAHANGEKAQTLSYKIWGRGINVWLNDIDRTYTAALLQQLSTLSGESIETLEETTLGAYIDKLVIALPRRGTLKWILPLSVTKDRQFGRGLQYCTQCLAGDAQPYFRKQWRVAFACCCPRHEILLSEGCPACGAPVGPHLSDHRHRYARYEHPLIQCHLCGTRLTLATPVMVPHHELLDFQRWLETGLAQGWFLIGDRVIYSPLFFEGLRMLCVFLARHRRSERLRPHFAQMGIDLAGLLYHVRRAGFEDLLLESRVTVLRAAAWLMNGWPDRLVDVCSAADVYSSYLLETGEITPFWFWEPIHLHLDRSWYAVSDAEVDAAWAYLKRTRVLATKRELASLLNVSYLNRRAYQRLR